MKKILSILILCLIICIFSSCDSFTTSNDKTPFPNPNNTEISPESTINVSTETPLKQEECHDHIYLFKTILAATCDTQGRQAYICEICGKKQHETSIDALGHKFQYSESLSTQCNCIDDGKKVEKCVRCPATKEEIRPAHGHMWYPHSFCDSITNEIIIKTDCSKCNKISTYEYRYKIDDVVRLVGKDDFYADLDYTLHIDQKEHQIQKSPYYEVYYTSTYILIVRNTKSFRSYYPSNLWKSAKDFYTSNGCTIVFKKNISIDKSGKIQFQN